jgi:predicted RNA-binding Zn ribbon-like protein
MDERDRRRIGEQVEPGGRPKAPGRLELLQRFVNSYNHDFPEDWDRIGTAEKAEAWLRAKKLIERDERVTEADAAELRALREAIRSLALANHGGRTDRDALAVIRRAARDASIGVEIDARGQTSLDGRGRGVSGAVATLLAILHEAQLTGHWLRMKGCRQCGYAFFDRSKNRSSAWCAMSICGNRTKNRTYYRRRHSPTG